jgi:hypothetical protein
VGDIETIWFVARDVDARALVRTEVQKGFNPFTKSMEEVVNKTFDAEAAARLPSVSEPWLLGPDVGDLLASQSPIRPEPVNGEQDELWRMPYALVRAFAALPEDDLPALHEAWSRKLAARKAPLHDEATGRRLHALAREAVHGDAGFYGFVEASGR